MTKCIVIGKQPKEVVKPIEFVKYLGSDYRLQGDCCRPNQWKYIELITVKYLNKEYDLMYAYDDKDREGILYLGHWNGGVV